MRSSLPRPDSGGNIVGVVLAQQNTGRKAAVFGRGVGGFPPRLLLGRIRPLLNEVE